MAVAAGEQRAIGEYRQVKHRTGGQLLAVDIAAECARLDGAHQTPMRRRGRAHDAEKRPASKRPSPGHLGFAGFPVQRDRDHPPFREVLGQRAAQGPECVPAPVRAEPRLQNVDLEYIARNGARDGDRPGQDMAGAERARRLSVDADQGFRNFKAFARKGVRRAGDRLDLDLRATLDGDRRLEPGIEEAPVDGVRRGWQSVGHGGGSGFGSGSGYCTGWRRLFQFLAG